MKAICGEIKPFHLRKIITEVKKVSAYVYTRTFRGNRRKQGVSTQRGARVMPRVVL